MSYLREKRIDNVPEWMQEDLAFDLINAFVLAKSPRDVALLLHDLLTTKEVKNLAKRLRIAKLLLSGEKYDDIIDRVHCSLGTVSKVRIWLDQGGEGLQKIILRLPKKRVKPGPPGGIPGYRLPQLLYAGIKRVAYRNEQDQLAKFLNRIGEKGILDKNIREQLAQEFRQEKRYRVRKA